MSLVSQGRGVSSHPVSTTVNPSQFQVPEVDPIPWTPLAYPLYGSVLQCAVPVVFCSPDSYCIVVWYPLAWSIVAARILC